MGIMNINFEPMQGKSYLFVVEDFFLFEAEIEVDENPEELKNCQ